MFKQNVGSVDQWLRYGAGLLLLVLAGAAIIGPWGYLLALVPLATAASRYCPLYRVLGIETCNSAQPRS